LLRGFVLFVLVCFVFVACCGIGIRIYKQALVPFAINQTGSIAYYYLLGSRGAWFVALVEATVTV
jgi:hypothetical protein